MNERLILEVPLLPEFVSTARLFIAAVGRSFDLDEEVVADLKIAVSEACTGAIQAERNGNGSQASGPVTLAVDVSENALVVEISSAGRFGPAQHEAWDPDTPTELFQKALGIGVINSLFPNAQFQEDPAERTTIRLEVPLTSSTPHQD